MATLGKTILIVITVLAFLPACTFHIKSKELEIEAKPPEATIGNVIETNHSYELVAIDVLKNADRKNPNAP